MLDKNGLSKENKEIVSQIEGKLSVIARQGRAFGRHLILSTQRPDANILTIYDNITINDYKIDYDLIFDIYNKMFEIGLNPKYVDFSYRTKKGQAGTEILSIKIYKENFSSINCPEDLKPFFEEATEKTINIVYKSHTNINELLYY